MSRFTIVVSSLLIIAGLVAVIIVDNRMVKLSEQQIKLTLPNSQALAMLNTLQDESATVQVDN